MLRKVIGFITGLITAMGIFAAFGYLGKILYPPPPGTDRADHEAMSQYIRTLPTAALIIELAGWALGAFVCGVLIRAISRSPDKTAAYLAGLFFTAASIVDLFVRPYPVWFLVAGVVIFIPVTLLGHYVTGGRKDS